MKDYIAVLKKNLEKQNFADGTLSKLKENIQKLQNQVENKEQSIAQLETQIKALKAIQ